MIYTIRFWCLFHVSTFHVFILLTVVLVVRKSIRYLFILFYISFLVSKSRSRRLCLFWVTLLASCCQWYSQQHMTVCPSLSSLFHRWAIIRKGYFISPLWEGPLKTAAFGIIWLLACSNFNPNSMKIYTQAP